MVIEYKVHITFIGYLVCCDCVRYCIPWKPLLNSEYYYLSLLLSLKSNANLTCLDV